MATPAFAPATALHLHRHTAHPLLTPRQSRSSIARPTHSHASSSAVPPPPPTPPAIDTPSPAIPNTPCFTPSLLSTPMHPSHRAVYLHAVATATAAYLSAYTPGLTPAVAQITLLVPQLNPELDVYDRRFLLQLVWSVLDITAASCRLRTRVLVQGTAAFGAIPLSVAGLRRMFDADLAVSAHDWPEGAIRSGCVEDAADLDDDDEIVVVVSPTNAVSCPVIDTLVDMVRRAEGCPVILINPRLADVPSHSGVMQVAGRKERMAFLDRVQDVFYLRLLFSAGTLYPLRGLLFHAYPGPWQVWKAEDSKTKYRLISSSPRRPTSSEITSAFIVHRYAEQKKRLDMESVEGASVDSLLASPPALAVLALGAMLGVAHFFGVDLQQVFRIVGGFAPL